MSKSLRRRPLPPNAPKAPDWTGTETPAPFDDPRVIAAREYWQKLRDADRQVTPVVPPLGSLENTMQDQPTTEE